MIKHKSKNPNTEIERNPLKPLKGRKEAEPRFKGTVDDISCWSYIRNVNKFTMCAA